MITHCFVNFAISRNVFVVAAAVVNKLMTSNYAHVSVNKKFYPYRQNTIKLNAIS